jgi:16S rRNA (guanine527-N7)-methyltransferase
MTPPDTVLLEQLARSRALGFLGPGPVDDQIVHAEAFVAALAGVTGTVGDLGSGGGVPGLVLAVARPDLQVVLIDALAKRCRFLEDAVRALGAMERVTVVEGRAEAIGRGSLRGSLDAVMARSFGPPSTTAECAAPLLRVGGVLVVSEPPDGDDRWPADGVTQLGLDPGEELAGPPRLRRLTQVAEVDERFPRRDGIPAKRLLF